MALEKIISIQNASIALWTNIETGEELKRILGDDSLIAKIEGKYNNPKRQREQLISHILVKELLGETKEIMHLPNGAPHIEGYDKYISISHSKKTIAVAISNKPIGIDIEDIERNQYKLHKKFTTPKEQEWINNNPELSQKQLISAVIWSTKEAIYKLANIEGLLFENEIEITPFNIAKESSFVATYRNTPCKCNFLVFGEEVLVFSC